MIVKLATPPVLECVTIGELKTHLRVSSGSFSDNIDQSQSIAPGDHAIVATYGLKGAGVNVLGYSAICSLISGPNGGGGTVLCKIQESDTDVDGDYTDWGSNFDEIMTLDEAPGGAGWSVGNVIKGNTSLKTCVIVTVLTTTTYMVKNRTGAYTLGEVLTNGTDDANQGGANPTFYQLTEGNDEATYEKEYTGTKEWIRTVATIAGATCDFGTTVIRLTATSIEDNLLNDDIRSAREHIEDITHRALLSQTWEYYLDRFPAGNRIKLPFGNLQTTSLAVTYDEVDGDGNKNTETLTLTTDYLIQTAGEGCGFIVLPYAGTWPTFIAWPVNPIKISFQCGWTTTALVPYKIKAVCLLIAADLYVNREAQVLPMSGQTYQENKTVMRLLASSRLWDEFI